MSELKAKSHIKGQRVAVDFVGFLISQLRATRQPLSPRYSDPLKSGPAQHVTWATFVFWESTAQCGAVAAGSHWWHDRDMDAPGDIIQLKVRLLGISPMIWRRVMVPTTMTLRELHGALQVVMGWEGIHLYAFDI